MNILKNPLHTFIIAEAGSNWKTNSKINDFEQIKKMVDVAVDCGADAIKFQTFRSENVYVQNAGTFNYLKNSNEQTISDVFKNNEMSYDLIPKISEYCNKKNILFMSSPFSVDDAKALNPYVSLHKIASFEINHVRLLEYLASTKKPLIISTGASTYDDIDFTVNLLKKLGNSEIVLLQCTSSYPAPIDSLNLSVIPKIKQKYDLPVGFSDHSVDPIIPPLLAVGYGATIIEKHFTLNKNLPGPDHHFALNPQELKQMIDTIRLADLAKGSGEKTILPIEQELRNFATRGIQAIKEISEGDVLEEGINFDILRSGNQKRGLEGRFLTVIQGKKSIRTIHYGEGISLDDIL